MTAIRQTSLTVANRLEVVDCLRGMAALVVCISHFMWSSTFKYHKDVIPA